jgi:hypothetical protein
MTRQIIIERTIEIINQLPEEKAQEISDFALFIMKRYEESILTKGVQTLSSQSHSFDFLKEEEDLYSLSDLKKVYNG